MSTLAFSSEAGAAGAVEMADQLHSVAIHLLRRLRREDAAAGLSAPQLSALSVVVFGGPLSLGELAAAEQVRPPTMTRLVRQLVERGLVWRRRDPGDRRVVRIGATPEGERMLAEGRRRRVASLAERLRSLDAGEREALASAIRTLQRVLEEP